MAKRNTAICYFIAYSSIREVISIDNEENVDGVGDTRNRRRRRHILRRDDDVTREEAVLDLTRLQKQTRREQIILAFYTLLLGFLIAAAPYTANVVQVVLRRVGIETQLQQPQQQETLQPQAPQQ